jgi:hypothetical protein
MRRIRSVAPRVALLAALLAALGATAALSACNRGPDVDIDDVDADALLVSAAERMEEVETFHFVLTHEGGMAEILRGLMMESAEGDVAGPDRMQMEVRARAGPLNVQVGIVVLPDQSFITNPITGRWEREAISLEGIFDPSAGATGLMRSVQDARVTGSDRIDGVDVYVVEATVDSGDLAFFAPEAEPGRSLPTRAWIGVDDPLLYRVEIEGAVAPGEPEGLVRRLSLSQFGADIEIVAPR